MVHPRGMTVTLSSGYRVFIGRLSLGQKVLVNFHLQSRSIVQINETIYQKVVFIFHALYYNYTERAGLKERLTTVSSIVIIISHNSVIRKNLKNH